MPAVILSYHRVADADPDALRLAVSPANFEQHLQIVNGMCLPTPLGELADSLGFGGPPARAVAVTLDDGYADTLTRAIPALERHGVPATVFVATGWTGGRREFWWDDLERLLLAPPSTPPRLSVRIGGLTREWPTATPPERRAAMLGLHALLRPADAAARLDAIDRIAAWAGLGPGGRPELMPMTADQLREASDSPLVDLGAHSVSHPVMSGLGEAAQRAEIAESREQLERITGRRAGAWAHPHGGPGDWDGRTEALLRGMGFRAACSSAEAAVSPGDDPLRMGRLTVRDWDGAELSRRLEALLDPRT